MRRLFIMRKDLHMSTGKLLAQVMHCAEAYWTSKIRKGNLYRTNDGQYMAQMTMPTEVYADYVCGSFTKTVCEAKNKNQLLKAKLLPRNWDLLKTLIMDASMISVLQNLSRKRITARHSLACGFVR